ncbi:ABC transporter permease subunit [Desulfosporosinus sp. Sb-LF]|uniref:ABC transporter permease n=1 Tax=Desulfosporosinus sp. Sb-LF TaxID=2560027 RepID=UPI001FB11482|nr:ABC transporter permease subunit [Desulfosporosinus sp. Sb-LF]
MISSENKLLQKVWQVKLKAKDCDYYGSTQGIIPIFLNTLHRIAAIDPKLKEVAYTTYGLSPWGMMTRVYLPSATPSIFVGMRLGLSYCWRSLVAAKLLGASKGIGYLIQEGREMAQTDLMLVGVFLIGLIGLIAMKKKILNS